ncbi:hypothetical protein [Candidatus Methanoprimaticola sp. MG2]|uniref:hypothetical protein n=1 Tax=Candidatus Methanoprimaticola sp. MG2 TaxID=3228838 RepID=UPI0039C6186C
MTATCRPRQVQYTMVLPDGRPLLFGAFGDRGARIFAFNWMLEHGVTHSFLIRRPAGKDPVPLFHIYIDGTMARVSESTDPDSVPLNEREWITRRFVLCCMDDMVVMDAELVYECNIPLMVDWNVGVACGSVSEGWCRGGFVNIEDEVVNGYTLEESKIGNAFKVWTVEMKVMEE